MDSRTGTTSSLSLALRESATVMYVYKFRGPWSVGLLIVMEGGDDRLSVVVYLLTSMPKMIDDPSLVTSNVIDIGSLFKS